MFRTALTMVGRLSSSNFTILSRFRNSYSQEIMKHNQSFHAMGTANDITVLEHTRIFPSSDTSIGTKTLSLSYMDIPWVCIEPVQQQLCFYEFPHPKSHFIGTIIPNLKKSLSIALQHFFPLAGNLIIFPFKDSSIIPRKPELRYVGGEDSISLTIAECTKDFIYLTGNHARKSNDLYPLVPKLRDIMRDSEYIKVPVLAIQVTLFPDHGICIGITHHHATSDANALVNFLRAWTSITKFGDDKPFLASGFLPLFGKSFIKDPNGMDEVVWRHLAGIWFHEAPRQDVSGSDDDFRASIIITRDQINKFKKSILAQWPTIAPISSFTIVCAHVWSCMAKLDDVIGEDTEQDMLVGAAESRGRFDPPIPSTYFGNCVVLFAPNAKHDQLASEGGFIHACKLIKESIHTSVKDNESIYATGKKFWTQDFSSMPHTAIGVSGSPKFDMYDTDFGWGTPKKCDLISIRRGPHCRNISLSVSRESKEDIEIGLSLSKIQLDIFETISTNELNKVAIEN